jgi:hypothetical protein
MTCLDSLVTYSDMVSYLWWQHEMFLNKGKKFMVSTEPEFVPTMWRGFLYTPQWERLHVKLHLSAPWVSSVHCTVYRYITNNQQFQLHIHIYFRELEVSVALYWAILLWIKILMALYAILVYYSELRVLSGAMHMFILQWISSSHSLTLSGWHASLSEVTDNFNALFAWTV